MHDHDLFCLFGLFCFLFFTIPAAVVWLREPLPPRPLAPWPGFFRASAAYMAGHPRWVFLAGLPRAWWRFQVVAEVVADG
ncbi:MAG: hypothetical protein GY913_21620 [Proteobacteria bacterium]|nr:hypothetical protein [Actinomycetes bacterium]MCP4919509.1 hypothetical protein [Pseudomonadota bacterium]